MSNICKFTDQGTSRSIIMYNKVIVFMIYRNEAACLRDSYIYLTEETKPCALICLAAAVTEHRESQNF